jgi:peptidoglycan hydrolase-like protein with peptidoglycan-binding domain/GH25 family lysozyme M1 (1,4-beta-N-acetylmuramidase)
MIYGADISPYQEGFNFQANRQFCPFILIKQTEGLTWPDQDSQRDTDTLRNMREEAAKQNYAFVGLYHFARPQHGRTGRDEAEHFIRFVGSLRSNEGVMLDYEANNGLDSEELEQFAIDFVGRIEQEWPTLVGNVLFYSYPGFIVNMSTDRLCTRCPLHIAAYGSNDGNEHENAIRLDRWHTFTLWQFSSTAVLLGDGRKGDMNRFDGGESDLVGLTFGVDGVVTPPPPPVVVPPPLRPPWPGEYLRNGSRGNNVQTLQQRLAERGWNIGVDGSFGPQTDTVVRNFQKEKGLTLDGIVGPATWDALWTAPVSSGDPVPIPAIPPFPGVMRRGAHGDGVRQLQQRLFDRGWHIGVDGEFGRQTDTVVRNFQKEKGLTLDGIVGQQTWDALWTTPGVIPQPAPPPPPPAPQPLPPPSPDGTLHPDPVGQINAWRFADGVAGFQISFAWWDLAVDGGAGPETAKAVQKVVNEGGNLSPHFNIEEWRSKGNGEVKCHRELLRAMERERDILGHPIGVVSGYRDPAHNERVGGAKNSQHLYGTAGDRRTLVSSCRDSGHSGVGTCGNECFHGDVRHAGPNNTTGGQPGNPTYWSYC